MALASGLSSLHAGWKAAQTLIEWASGIATAVQAIKQAAGGGVMHRTGLSDTVLLFAEHRAFLPDQEAQALIRLLRADVPERKIALEVGDVPEALAFAEADADILQLEKFGADLVAQVVQAVSAGCPIR